VGAWLGSRWEHTRTGEERAAIVHTMGHLPWMQTHEVTADPAAAPAPATDFAAGAAFNSGDTVLLRERKPSDDSYRERTAGWVRHFAGGAVLTHKAMDPNNPLDGTASPRAGVAKSLSGWTYPFEPAGVQ
jgi:hypothetical protein